MTRSPAGLDERPVPRSPADLTDRRIIVTGGGAGIGRAIVRTLALHGAHVGIIDEIPARIDAVVREVEEAGGTACGIVADISNEQAGEAAIKELADRWSNIDTLVNCAGIIDDLRPVGNTPTELWDRVIAINLTAAFVLTRAVLPLMIQRGRGSIINIASEAGFRGGTGGAAYTVSKHGLVGLTRSVAWAYRNEGIRCNAVCPGAIGGTEIMAGSCIDPADSDRLLPIMSLAGEPGIPQSIADVVLFLASEQSAFVNGAVLPVDGGWSPG